MGNSNIRKNLLYCKDDQTPVQVVCTGCEVSVLGEVQNPTGHCPGQPALGDLV